jgi:translocator protein
MMHLTEDKCWTDAVTMKSPKRKLKLWQAALLLVGVTIVGALSAGRSKKNRKFYETKEKQAPWAPPGWVFGPAWTFNNLSLIWGLRRIINNPSLDRRDKLLALQGGIWIIFLSFGYAYFRKRSPILAEVWTQTDAILAMISFVTALKSDKKLAMSYVPLLAWTSFASTLSGYQALKNPDPVFHTQALLS